MSKRVRRFPAWLLTFADLMSLLLVIFVLFFALSGQEEKKYLQTIESFNEALVGEDGLSYEQRKYIKESQSDAPAVDELKNEVDLPETIIDPLYPLYTNLIKTFKNIKGGERVNLEYDPQSLQIKITFPEQISFDPGSAELKPRFSKMLASAFDLKMESVMVEVIGHTDKRPVVGGRFYSNWELSSARAANVIVELIDLGLLRPSQGRAVGVAATQPAAKGDNIFSYAKNRRVEVLIRSAKPKN